MPLTPITLAGSKLAAEQRRAAQKAAAATAAAAERQHRAAAKAAARAAAAAANAWENLQHKVPELDGHRATLIVCPLSVLSNWVQQLEEHTDGSLKARTACWLRGK